MNRTGFSIGVTYEYLFKKNLFIRLEICVAKEINKLVKYQNSQLHSPQRAQIT